MAAFKSSFEGAAATIPKIPASGLSSIELSHSKENPELFRSLVHFRWHFPDVNLMRPLLASRSHLCFASHQQGMMMS